MEQDMELEQPFSRMDPFMRGNTGTGWNTERDKSDIQMEMFWKESFKMEKFTATLCSDIPMEIRERDSLGKTF